MRTKEKREERYGRSARRVLLSILGRHEATKEGHLLTVKQSNDTRSKISPHVLPGDFFHPVCLLGQSSPMRMEDVCGFGDDRRSEIRVR